ncbi:hypothetical protein RUM44_010040 [Polyplax serrata]|uniref:Uncharacterized protein n=1 Tax=Polyplax serrata TaxID=468196 RepID=A0ABR1AUH2_POLSC
MNECRCVRTYLTATASFWPASVTSSHLLIAQIREKRFFFQSMGITFSVNQEGEEEKDSGEKDPENLQPKFAINYYRSIIFGFLPDPNESRDPVQENSTGKGNYAPCPWMFQSFRDRYFVPKSTQNPTRTIP